MPGGPACLSGSLATFLEGRALEDALRFLIRVHDLHRVVLIAHEGCAYYRDRLAVPELLIAEQQRQDLEKAVRAVREAARGPRGGRVPCSPRGRPDPFRASSRSGSHSARSTVCRCAARVSPRSLLLLAFLAVRTYRLTSLPIFIDESLHLFWSLRVREDLELDRPLRDGKPLQALVTAFTVPGADDPLWAGRFTSVLVGAVGMWAAWQIGRRLFDEATGLTAAALYLACPFTLFYDRMALSDVYLSTFAALTLLASIAVARDPRPAKGLWLGLALAGCVLAKVPGLMLAPLPRGRRLPPAAAAARPLPRARPRLWGGGAPGRLSGLVLPRQERAAQEGRGGRGGGRGGRSPRRQRGGRGPLAVGLLDGTGDAGRPGRGGRGRGPPPRPRAAARRRQPGPGGRLRLAVFLLVPTLHPVRHRPLPGPGRAYPRAPGGARRPRSGPSSRLARRARPCRARPGPPLRRRPPRGPARGAAAAAGALPVRRRLLLGLRVPGGRGLAARRARGDPGEGHGGRRDARAPHPVPLPADVFHGRAEGGDALARPALAGGAPHAHGARARASDLRDHGVQAGGGRRGSRPSAGCASRSGASRAACSRGSSTGSMRGRGREGIRKGLREASRAGSDPRGGRAPLS